MSGFLKRAAVFLLGAYAVIVQVIFLREFLVVFLGNELSFGIIFFSWFTGVWIGAAASSRPARSASRGEGTFILLGSAAAVVAPLLLAAIRIVRRLLGVSTGEYIPFIPLLLSTWALVLPFSFIVGFIFPFACLLAMGGRGGRAANIGRVYVLEAAGSVAGGAAFSFLLVGRVCPFTILACWGAALTAVLALLERERAGRRPRTLLLFALPTVLALFAATGVTSRLDRASVEMRWRSINPKIPLVTSVDSRYENIALGVRAGQYDLFGNGQHYFSFPDPYGYASVAHMIMSEHPDPRRVLLVGGGAGGLIRELLKYRLTALDYVQLDPLIITVTKRYLPPQDREALAAAPVRVFYEDGRRFVKEARGRYDMVIVQMPDPSTAMLNRYYTVEFFEEVRRILAPGGVLSTRIRAPVDYYGWAVGNYAGSVYRTLKTVFPHVIVTPTEENYFFASVSPGILSTDIPTLQKRWEARGITTPYFTKYHFLVWWLPERTAFVRRSLESQSAAPLDTDFRPVTYFLNLILWARYSGSGISRVLKAINGVGVAWYLGAILVMFAARLCWTTATGRRGGRTAGLNALLSLGTTGFAAMALELVLIFGFQNIYGYVYQMLGLIVALFMSGLGIGGFAANRLLLRRGRRWDLWLAGLDLVLCGYLLAIPALMRGTAAGSGWRLVLFMGLVFVAGLLTGAAFPLGARIYMRGVANLGRTAALADASDHMGASAGSLFIGVIAVPLLGIVSTCLVVAAMKLCTGLLLVSTRDISPVQKS